MASAPSASVVVPTYDRLASLRSVLRGLAAQTVPEGTFETIVVSDGSTDGTDEYLASPCAPVAVRLLRQRNQGPAAARNAGVRAARGPIVVFLDDDVVPTPPLVARHLAAHRRYGDGVVVLGPMSTPPDHRMSPWVAYEQAMLDKQYEAMRRGDWTPTARQFYTGNASLRRDHVLLAGGFDTTFARAEDVELAYRLAGRGLRFVFDPLAVGLHYAQRPYEAWRRTPYVYGRNDVIFARDRGQSWLLPEVRREFAHHHVLLRLALRATLGRPRLQRCVTGVCELVARAGGPPARAALSAVYNLAYHRGVADELGSPRWLFAGPADGHPTGRPPRRRQKEHVT